MKPREQALLLLKKAAQDESLLDAVLQSDLVSAEIFGFHCQHAAEKMLRRSSPTWALGGESLPSEFGDLDALTPFGAVYRYEDCDSPMPLDRTKARAMVRDLRAWAEARLRDRSAEG